MAFRAQEEIWLGYCQMTATSDRNFPEVKRSCIMN